MMSYRKPPHHMLMPTWLYFTSVELTMPCPLGSASSLVPPLSPYTRVPYVYYKAPLTCLPPPSSFDDARNLWQNAACTNDALGVGAHQCVHQ